MTVLDLIKSSLRLLGVLAAGETPESADSNDANDILTILLEEWQNEGLISLTEQQSFSVSSGTLNYTIGSGQTWDGNKPLDILAATLRDSDGYDTNLKIIGEKEYLALHDKDMSAKPTKLFYAPSNSTGVVYLYGQPDANYTIILLKQAAFTTYTDLTTTINLPAGYLQALRYNLAVEIAPEYEITPSAWIVSQSNEKVAKIKRTNRKKPKPLQFDPIFNNVNTYDIESDTYV
jgi:hypothetical protein